MTDSSIFDLSPSIKLAYPAGTYRACNWILAQRQIMRLQEQGVFDEELGVAAELYAKQQQAMGKAGTQYILSPENFYGAKGLDHWRGPFPLPANNKQEAETVWPLVHDAIRNGRWPEGIPQKAKDAVGELGGLNTLGMRPSAMSTKTRAEFVSVYSRLTCA